MIMLSMIILMMTLTTASAQVECSRTFPVWQVCAANKPKDPRTVVSTPAPPSDGDGHGKGHDKDHGKDHDKK